MPASSTATRYKSYQVKMDFSEGERAVVGTITTDAIDRDKEVILPEGIDLRAFRLNPVVLLNHNGQGFPVGKSLWIKPSTNGKGLVSKTVFSASGDGPKCHELFKEGVFCAFSIGFKPDYKSMGPPTAEEIKARPELAGCNNVIRKCELLEYSVVTVPANPQALALAVSKGVKMPDWVDTAIDATKTKATAPAADEVPEDEPDGDEPEGNEQEPDRAAAHRFKADMIGVAEGIRHSDKKGIMHAKCYGKQAHWVMHKDDINHADDMGYHSPAEIKAMCLAAGCKKAFATVGDKPEGKGWEQVHPDPIAGKSFNLDEGLTCLADSRHDEGDYEAAKAMIQAQGVKSLATEDRTAFLLWTRARRGDEATEVVKWLNDREGKAATMVDPSKRAKWGLSFDAHEVRQSQSSGFAHLLTGAVSIDTVKATQSQVAGGLKAVDIKSIVNEIAQENLDKLRGRI